MGFSGGESVVAVANVDRLWRKVNGVKSFTRTPKRALNGSIQRKHRR